MKKLARVVQFAKEAGINRQVALDDFLLAYRATPHTSTGVSPSDLMFGHSRTCGLPRIEPNATQLLEWHKKARASDEAYKSKSEKAYNDRMRTSDSVLQVGDHVLLRREEKRKDQTRWDPEPYTITTKNGSMVTAARSDRQTTRNSSWFKRFNTPQESLSIAPSSAIATGEESAPSQPNSSSPQLKTSNVIATPAHFNTTKPKQGVGRPTKEASLQRAAQREMLYEQRRMQNPPAELWTRNDST